MYIFLNNNYFSKVAFSLMYLLGKKTKAFIDILKPLKLKKCYKKLRLLVKYQDKIK